MIHKVTLLRKDIDKVEVFLDSKLVGLERSLRVINHSPTGFNAGYPGSGPAQTALAILLKLLPKQEAVRYHQQFKSKYLAKPKYLELGQHVFTFDLDDLKEGAQ